MLNNAFFATRRYSQLGFAPASTTPAATITPASSPPKVWASYFFYKHVVRKDLLNTGLFFSKTSLPCLLLTRSSAVLRANAKTTLKTLPWFALLELAGGSFVEVLNRSDKPAAVRLPPGGTEGTANQVHLISWQFGRDAEAYDLIAQFYFLWFRGLKRTHERAVFGSRARVAPLGKNLRLGREGGAVGVPSLSREAAQGLDGNVAALLSASSSPHAKYLRFRHSPELLPSRLTTLSVVWRDFDPVMHLPLNLTRRCGGGASFLAQFCFAAPSSLEVNTFLMLMSGFRLRRRFRQRSGSAEEGGGGAEY